MIQETLLFVQNNWFLKTFLHLWVNGVCFKMFAHSIHICLLYYLWIKLRNYTSRIPANNPHVIIKVVALDAPAWLDVMTKLSLKRRYSNIFKFLRLIYFFLLNDSL